MGGKDDFEVVKGRAKTGKTAKAKAPIVAKAVPSATGATAPKVAKKVEKSAVVEKPATQAQPQVIADNTLVIKGLPATVGDDLIRRHHLCGQYGRIVNLHREGGNFSVTYSTAAETTIAASCINGARFGNAQVYCKFNGKFEKTATVQHSIEHPEFFPAPLVAAKALKTVTPQSAIAELLDAPQATPAAEKAPAVDRKETVAPALTAAQAVHAEETPKKNSAASESSTAAGKEGFGLFSNQGFNGFLHSEERGDLGRAVAAKKESTKEVPHARLATESNEKNQAFTPFTETKPKTAGSASTAAPAVPSAPVAAVPTPVAPTAAPTPVAATPPAEASAPVAPARKPLNPDAPEFIPRNVTPWTHYYNNYSYPNGYSYDQYYYPTHPRGPWSHGEGRGAARS